MAQRVEVERLTTWAEIGAYIGRDARTAKRYEAERGLPVRRMPGGGKSTVYAYRQELDSWMKRPEPPAPASAEDPVHDPSAPTPPPSAARRAPVRGRGLWAGLAAAGVAAVAVVAALALHRTPAAAREQSTPAVRNLYQQGVYAWSRRTPDGIRQAIDLFTQAIVLDPSYAPAYAGLADCYDLAPEFAGIRPQDAYPRAKAAAERAIALDPSSADAHRALAFVTFWWEQKPQRAFAEFRTALKLDPKSAQTTHWFANALATRRDPDALAQIAATLAVDPTTPAMADRGYALMQLGHDPEAASQLRQVVKLDAAYAPAHAYLATLAYRHGDYGPGTAELRRAAELSGDADLLELTKAAEAGLQGGGAQGLFTQVAQRERTLISQGRGSPYQAAWASTGRHDRAAALAWLRQAKAEHDPSILSLDWNPEFAWLRSDPAFQALARLDG